MKILLLTILILSISINANATLFLSFWKQLTLGSSEDANDNYEQSVAMQSIVYSLASYCSPKNVASWNCIPCKNQPSPTESTVVYNKTENHCIVFRGTVPWELQNWIDDIDFIKTPYKYCSGCNVHQGFYYSYLNLRDQMMNALTLFRNKYPGSKLLVTGHSLGAAIATHCAVDLFAGLQIKDFSLYTFGSPRVDDQAFSTWFGKTFQNTYWRITHDRDPVSHLPLEAMGFVHPLREVFYPGGPQNYQLCSATNPEDPQCSDKYYLDGNLLDHLTYLGQDFSVDILNCQ